jgi:hypothetical protein
MEGLEIRILNSSRHVWQRNVWAVGAGSRERVNWSDEVTKTPAETLVAHNSGTEAAAMSVHASFIVKDALYMQLGYSSESMSFAVQLQQLFHLFGIGPQSQWSYHDSGAWSASTADTSPHTWTFDDCRITASPALSDSAGFIQVIISDHKKG